MKTCSIENCTRASRSNKMCSTHASRKRRGLPLNAVIVSPDEDAPLSIRFWPKINRDEATGCWVWGGYVAKHGYGKMRDQGRHVYAHRFSWELHNGKLRKGEVIDHMCYNKACVNPAHLRATGHPENVQNAPGLRSDNTTGHRNVYLHKPSGKWYVSVKAFGERHYGGYFPNIEDAVEKATEMRASLHSIPASTHTPTDYACTAHDTRHNAP